MKVASPEDFSHVAPLGRPVEKGEVVDVDDVLGAQLVAQGWKADTAKSRSRAGDVSAPSAQSEEN